MAYFTMQTLPSKQIKDFFHIYRNILHYKPPNHVISPTHRRAFQIRVETLYELFYEKVKFKNFLTAMSSVDKHRNRVLWKQIISAENGLMVWVTVLIFIPGIKICEKLRPDNRGVHTDPDGCNRYAVV